VGDAAAVALERERERKRERERERERGIFFFHGCTGSLFLAGCARTNGTIVEI